MTPLTEAELAQAREAIPTGPWTPDPITLWDGEYRLTASFFEKLIAQAKRAVVLEAALRKAESIDVHDERSVVLFKLTARTALGGE